MGGPQGRWRRRCEARSPLRQNPKLGAGGAAHPAHPAVQRRWTEPRRAARSPLATSPAGASAKVAMLLLVVGWSRARGDGSPARPGARLSCPFSSAQQPTARCIEVPYCLHQLRVSAWEQLCCCAGAGGHRSQPPGGSGTARRPAAGGQPSWIWGVPWPSQARQQHLCTMQTPPARPVSWRLWPAAPWAARYHPRPWLMKTTSSMRRSAGQ